MDIATSNLTAEGHGIDALAGVLERASDAVGPCVSPGSPLLARLAALRERLQHNRLQLAVLGQFKRGKSTFINALLGAPLLPIAVVPLTAVPVFISWRSRPLVVVRFRDDYRPEEFTADQPDAIRDFLFRFVAEEANPENRLGVARVDLFYPADILADGTVLIDTPGVGSTLRHNTEAAFAVLPECDAVLFVLSADPPITEVELDYLRRLGLKAARVLFVLNKIDYLAADERRQVADFLRKTLDDEGAWRPDAQLFAVSARNGLEAKCTGDRGRIEESGIAEVETYLLRNLASEKARLLRTAIRRNAAECAAQAGDEASLRIRALEMPLEDLADRSRTFAQALRSIEEQRRVTRDLLGGDRRRLREALESRIDALRREIGASLAEVIDRAMAATPGRWEDTGQEALSAAIRAAFDDAGPQLTDEFSKSTNGALAAHRERIDALIESVRRTAAEIFQVPFRKDVGRESFALREEPYWVTEQIKATLIPDPSGLIERFLPQRARTRRLRARIVRHMQELVLRNAENLRWAILRGMDETFRNAAASLQERLDDAIATTRGVIEQALERRKNRSAAVEAEVARLKRASSLLSAVSRELDSNGPP